MHRLWITYDGSLEELVKQAYKYYASKKSIQNVKEELWERSDIFCNDWYGDVFTHFVDEYRDIDFFPDPTPRLRYPTAKKPYEPYVILGGFYGWSRNTHECELLAVGVLDIEHAKLIAYDREGNPVQSSEEKV